MLNPIISFDIMNAESVTNALSSKQDGRLENKIKGLNGLLCFFGKLLDGVGIEKMTPEGKFIMRYGSLTNAQRWQGGFDSFVRICHHLLARYSPRNRLLPHQKKKSSFASHCGMGCECPCLCVYLCLQVPFITTNPIIQENSISILPLWPQFGGYYLPFCKLPV